MRGTKAKKLRKQFYGDLSLRNRRYMRIGNGQIVADVNRRMYQKAKKSNK